MPMQRSFNADILKVRSADFSPLLGGLKSALQTVFVMVIDRICYECKKSSLGLISGLQFWHRRPPFVAIFVGLEVRSQIRFLGLVSNNIANCRRAFL